MKHMIAICLTACFLIGCAKEKAPPIRIEVIAPALTQQLKQKLGESFLKVGKVDYKSTEDTYLVEFYYTHEDQEKRFIMPMLTSHDSDDRNVIVYKGIFPLRLIGDQTPAEVIVDFKIDELMNK